MKCWWPSARFQAKRSVRFLLRLFEQSPIGASCQQTFHRESGGCCRAVCRRIAVVGFEISPTRDFKLRKQWAILSGQQRPLGVAAGGPDGLWQRCCSAPRCFLPHGTPSISPLLHPSASQCFLPREQFSPQLSIRPSMSLNSLFLLTEVTWYLLRKPPEPRQCCGCEA